MLRKHRISSVQLIPMSFLAAILAGTLLLMLPICTAPGEKTPFLTALFTATTSVCVTGLVVVDTFSHWSTLGHLVILGLIQIGGLGVITVNATMMLLVRRRFSLGDRLLLQDALNLERSAGILGFLVKLLRGTLIVEGAGALLYALAFVPAYGWIKGLWVSLFNAVSAFCNAGIDIIGPASLKDYQSSPMVLGVTMGLIVLGGLGYVVWFDLSSKVRSGVQRGYSPRVIWKRLSEHTRLVLVLTFVLIAGGALLIYVLEFRNPRTLGSMPMRDRVLNSIFESVTLRTAGFDTFPQENMNTSSCLVAYLLMFIGGSPVGTAGGVKTVTFFLAAMNVITYIRDEPKKTVFGRTLSAEQMRKATAIVAVSLLSVLVLSLVLMSTNPRDNMTDSLFEVVSALGTVGLTRNLTATLNSAGRLIIILGMYLGRIGPISMAIFFARSRRPQPKISYIDGDFFVG